LKHEQEILVRQKAARKFSFGAPQDSGQRQMKSESKPKVEQKPDISTIKIENKNQVILIGKRPSAMRPGMLSQTPTKTI
jgi:hypothetical protein